MKRSRNSRGFGSGSMQDAFKILKGEEMRNKYFGKEIPEEFRARFNEHGAYIRRGRESEKRAETKEVIGLSYALIAYGRKALKAGNLDKAAYWLIQAERVLPGRDKASMNPDKRAKLESAYNVLARNYKALGDSMGRNSTVKYGARTANRREIYNMGEGCENLAYKLEYDSNQASRGRARLPRRLAAAAATTAVVGLIGSIFFLSSNFTGNVIGLNQTASNVAGVVLFILGLASAGIYFWKK